MCAISPIPKNLTGIFFVKSQNELYYYDWLIQMKWFLILSRIYKYNAVDLLSAYQMIIPQLFFRFFFFMLNDRLIFLNGTQNA